MIGASEQVVYYLRQAVKQAWFGEADVRGDLSYVDKMFWDSTEPAFYRQIKALLEQAASTNGIGHLEKEYGQAQAAAWHAELSKKALRLFDVDIVGAGPISQQEPRRVSRAYRGLKYNLDGKALRAILGLPAPLADKVAKSSRRKPGAASDAQEAQEAQLS
jgi:CRISPR system Cascade subunit CasA